MYLKYSSLSATDGEINFDYYLPADEGIDIPDADDTDSDDSDGEHDRLATEQWVKKLEKLYVTAHHRPSNYGNILN